MKSNWIRPPKSESYRAQQSPSLHETTRLAKQIIILQSDQEKSKLSAERQTLRENFSRSIERMAPVETSPVAVKNLALDSFSFMRKSQESDPIPLYTASSKGSDQKTSESKSRKKSKGLMKSRKRLSKGIKRALKTFSSSGMTSTIGSTSESEHKREIEVVMPLQERKQSNCSNNRGIIVKKAKKHVKKRQN